MKIKKGFTLVEVIVVIIILTILITIGNIQYLGFTKKGRNTVRLQDMNNLLKSFELFSMTSITLPKPSNGIEITYSGSRVWLQGTIGDSVILNLSRYLTKKPVDPLTQQEYTYSLLNNNKEFQIKMLYENNTTYSLLNQTFAKENNFKIKGNFNGELASVKINNNLTILSIPSIIISDTKDFDLLKIIKKRKYLYDYNLGIKNFVPKKLELYSGELNDIKKVDNKIKFLNNYKKAYNNYKNKSNKISLLENININNDNYDSDIEKIVNNLLLSINITLDQISNKQIKIISDNFNINKIYEEVGSVSRNFNDRWWVNSGAFFYVENGVGKTIHGELKEGSKRQEKYANYKGGDETDGGFHPQNIFRLVLNEKFKNFTQSAYFKINRYILSNNKHRWDPNGILLFNRYIDGYNLYYAGLRVDGAVVIKKKYKGKYYTLAYNKILDGVFNRETNPILISKNKWIGLKTEVKNLTNNDINIKLYTDLNNNGNWTLRLNVIDNINFSGTGIINTSGYAGIRTDFMDVEIDKYYIKEI